MGLGRCLLPQIGAISLPWMGPRCCILEHNPVNPKPWTVHLVRGACRKATVDAEDRRRIEVRSCLPKETVSRYCNVSSLSRSRIWEGQIKMQHAVREKVSKFAMSAAGNQDSEAAEHHIHSSTMAEAPAGHPCLYVKNSLASGETIDFAGTVIVLGDVNEGGRVMAEGDIIVLGRLQGDVHGGRSGDRGAIIYALQLDARGVRIAGTIAPSDSHFAPYPVIVSVQKNGTLGTRAAAAGRNYKEDSSELNISNLLNGEKESLRPAIKLQTMDRQKALKRPAQIAMFTGVYISIVGMALLLFPTSLFGLIFDVRSVTVGWIRVGAILAVVFGVYYIGTAVGDLRGISGAWSFYISTVVGRMFLFFSFCWLVAAGAAQPALLLVAVVNMMGAVSMLIALHQASTAAKLQS